MSSRAQLVSVWAASWRPPAADSTGATRRSTDPASGTRTTTCSLTVRSSISDVGSISVIAGPDLRLVTRLSQRLGGPLADRLGGRYRAPAEEVRVRDRAVVRGRGLSGAVRLDPAHPRVRARRCYRRHEYPPRRRGWCRPAAWPAPAGHVAEEAADRQHLLAAVQRCSCSRPQTSRRRTGRHRVASRAPAAGRSWSGRARRRASISVIVRGPRRLERGVKQARPADDGATDAAAGSRSTAGTGEHDRGQVPAPCRTRAAAAGRRRLPPRPVPPRSARPGRRSSRT